MPQKHGLHERAARALCRLDGHPEDIMFESLPMWMNYLPQVKVVLEAALGPETYEKLVRDNLPKE